METSLYRIVKKGTKTMVYYGNEYAKDTRSCNIVIPASYGKCLPITGITKFAFANCDNIESVVIPSFVNIIDVMAFHNCTSIKMITIPSTFIHVTQMSFYGDNQIQRINVIFGTSDSWFGTSIGIFDTMTVFMHL